jgi:hypothetical protein
MMRQLQQEIDIGQWDDFKQENARVGMPSARGWITFSDPGCLAGGYK